MASCLTIVILGLFLAAITAGATRFQLWRQIGSAGDGRNPTWGVGEWTLYTCIEYSYACNCYKFKRDGTACRLPSHRYGACHGWELCAPDREFRQLTEEPSTPTTQTDPTTKN
uniref:Putative secreted protein n=1 Tax=Ixodes ricinus TaxID=34613 RepID=V5HL72_IXORI